MTSQRRAMWTALVALLSACGASHAADAVDFKKDVQPILREHCVSCHGDEKQKGGLRLDHAAEAMQGGDSGVAITPGDPAKSHLLELVRGDDPDEIMPPKGRRLNKAKIDTLTTWIAAGANWPDDAAAPARRKIDHWSFEPITRPAPPAVKHPRWVRNPIDRFILAKLEAAGLEPSAKASRRTLIRRLSLDLIGLPPTPERADAFAADRSPDAYERVVDELLASPRFGEHWARMWLDLARYADSKGYEKDKGRNIWRYRDWVINAFNADMPYDRFTTEQLAGDLLPNATNEQILATAMHRNTMSNDEGGTDNEEFRIVAVKDRVDTTVQVWMGLTMGCAKCHTHKYDPITMREYYSFFAIFNQTEDADRPDDHPLAPTPTQTQRDQLDALAAKIDTLNAKLRGPLDAELTAAKASWDKSLVGAGTWTPLSIRDAASANGTTLKPQSDGSVLATGKTPERDTYTFIATSPLRRVTALRLDALTDKSMKRNGPGRNGRDPNFVVSELTVRVTRDGGEPREIKLTNPRADFEQRGWPAKNSIDGNAKTGWAVSPKFSQPHTIVYDLAEPLELADSDAVTVAISQQYGQRLVLGRVRVSVSDGDASKLKPTPNDLASLAAIPAARRTPQQKQQLRDAFLKQHPSTKPLSAELAKLTSQRQSIEKQIPKTPIMRELPANRQRASHLHVRGNFLEKGPRVEPELLTAFGSVPDEKPTRLTVARWLMQKDNPLTARVAVNRVWAQLFGIGIVETEEDFGIQGTKPTHPQLLDWLATEFRDTHGWSHKKLIKTIVMSSTYRQSSATEPGRLAADPNNRLLSRSPRFRVPAEVVRDQTLASAGLLSAKIGGPSVMPPQPDGVWKAVYNGASWVTSTGEDRYRRGLYTYWRRTSPYPSMTTFDAGSREVCVIRRVRTNTPLQALVTLNDPVFVEAAGALARRIIAEAGDDPRDRARCGLRLVVTREPDLAEIERVVKLYDTALQRYTADANAAEALIAEGPDLPRPANVTPAQLAAWTAVANVLLNLDESLMRN